MADGAIVVTRINRPGCRRRPDRRDARERRGHQDEEFEGNGDEHRIPGR
jgi:hypothetical protein